MIQHMKTVALALLIAGVCLIKPGATDNHPPVAEVAAPDAVELG